MGRIRIKADLVPPDEIEKDLPAGIRVFALDDMIHFILGEVSDAALGEIYNLPFEKRLLEIPRITARLQEMAKPYEKEGAKIGHRLRQFVENGVQFEKSGKIDRAIEQYEQAIAEHWYPTHAYTRLMVLYSKEKRYRDAIRVCETYLKTLDYLRRFRPGHSNLKLRDEYFSKIEKFREKQEKHEQRIQKA